MEREKSIKETLLGLLQNLSDLKLFARNSKQFMKLVRLFINIYNDLCFNFRM